MNKSKVELLFETAEAKEVVEEIFLAARRFTGNESLEKTTVLVRLHIACAHPFSYNHLSKTPKAGLESLIKGVKRFKGLLTKHSGDNALLFISNLDVSEQLEMCLAVGRGDAELKSGYGLYLKKLNSLMLSEVLNNYQESLEAKLEYGEYGAIRAVAENLEQAKLIGSLSATLKELGFSFDSYASWVKFFYQQLHPLHYLNRDDDLMKFIRTHSGSLTD